MGFIYIHQVAVVIFQNAAKWNMTLYGHSFICSPLNYV